MTTLEQFELELIKRRKQDENKKEKFDEIKKHQNKFGLSYQSIIKSPWYSCNTYFYCPNCKSLLNEENVNYYMSIFTCICGYKYAFDYPHTGSMG